MTSQPARPLRAALGLLLLAATGPAPYYAFKWGVPAGLLPPDAWAALRPWLLAAGALLAVAGAIRVLSLRPGGLPGDRRDAPAGLPALLALVACLSLLPLNGRLAVLTLAAIIGAAGFALVVSGSPPGAGAWAIGTWRWLRVLPRGRFLAGAFLVSLALHLAVGWAAFRLLPSIPDSLVQLFQARLFLSGRLWAPSPPEPGAFRFLFMINDGRWFSQYPPGHPLLLAAGLFLGTPWLVVPFLGAVAVPALYALGRETGGEETGRLAALLALVSPFWNLMCGEFLSHTPTLLLAVVFAWMLLRARRAPLSGETLSSGLLAGAALGTTLNIRPLAALALGAAGALWALVARGAPAGRRAGTVALLAPGALAGAAALLWYNHATTGHPLRFGYHLTQGPLFAMGFGLRRMNEEEIPFTPLLAAEHSVWHLGGLGLFGLGSPVPLLLLAFLPFLRRRRPPAETLLLLLALVTPAAYFFYPFTDPVLGPRMVFESLAFLLVLGARAILLSPVLARGLPGAGAVLRAPGAAAAALLLPALASRLPSDVVFNALLHRIPRARMEAAMPPEPGHPSLVLLPDRVFDVCGFARLSPDLDRTTIYARDRGPRNLALLEAFPERVPYLARGRPGTEALALHRIVDPSLDLVALARGGPPGFAGAEGVVAESARVEDRDWSVLAGISGTSSAEFRLAPPAHAVLLFTPFPLPQTGASVEFIVEISPAGEAPRELFRRVVPSSPPGEVVTLPPEVELDLGPWANQDLVLRLRTEARPAPPGAAPFVWVLPRVAARIPVGSGATERP